VPVATKITGHRTDDSIFRHYPIVDEEQKRYALRRTQQYLFRAHRASAKRFG
jgi:hypothetical protein